MDTTKKILLETFVIFTTLIGIFVIGNLFGTSTLLITTLLVLFFKEKNIKFNSILKCAT